MLRILTLLLLSYYCAGFTPMQPSWISSTNFTTLILETRRSQGVERHMQLLDSDGDSRISAIELQRAIRSRRNTLTAAITKDDAYLTIQGGLTVHRELLEALRQSMPRAEAGVCPQCPIDVDALAMFHHNPLEQLKGGSPYDQEEWEDFGLELSETACFPPDDEGKGLWEGSAVPGRMRQRCDIPIETSLLTPTAFRTKYFDLGKPVIIRNASHGWPARSRWSNRTALLNAYGEDTFRTGFKPPLMATRETLRKFLADMSDTVNPRPKYLWDEAMRQVRFAPRKRHPVEDASIPLFIAQLAKGQEGSRYGIGAASFTAGPACSGAHFHRHSQAFNALVGGLKYWVLVPPAEGDGDDDAMIPASLVSFLQQVMNPQPLPVMTFPLLGLALIFPLCGFPLVSTLVLSCCLAIGNG